MNLFDMFESGKKQGIEEACWKGYHKEGMKTMFGKRYPNCVKNKNESLETYVNKGECPGCGGTMVSEEQVNEKQDACYHKVKSRYKVWPSAYASGALVQCRKKGAANWGNKNESITQEEYDQLDENLKQWFSDKWVRFGPDGKIRGDCARGDSSEGKPKCLPQSKAHALGKKGRASAAARKRREDPNPERSGKAINVATKKKSNEGMAEGKLNFEEGDCPIFAIALHRLSKMPLMALVEYDEQMGSTVLIHAYVKLDDRWRLDASGETDVDWMLQKYPNNGNAEEIEISEKYLLELGYGKSKCPTLQQVLPHAKEVLQNIEEGQQGMTEAKKKRKKKSSRSMRGYFFPGYAYYGGGESGDGGGEGVEEGSNKKQEATRRIQKMLNDKFGANLDVDGVLGPLTLKSINKFMPNAKVGPAKDPNKTTAVQGKKIKNEDTDQEQLAEKWSQKYKSSINCSNPKGFSQRAHCDGKKKNEDILETSEYNHSNINDDDWYEFDSEGNVVRQSGPRRYELPFGSNKTIKLPNGNIAAKGMTAKRLKLFKNLSESRDYYNVMCTDAKSLRQDFNMSKDRHGWFLKEGSTPKQKLDVYRAFGSPKLKEYDLSAFSGGTQTKGEDNVISPVGSQTRAQYKK